MGNLAMQQTAISFQQSAWAWIVSYLDTKQPKLSVIPVESESGRKLSAESCQPINLKTRGGGYCKWVPSSGLKCNFNITTGP